MMKHQLAEGWQFSPNVDRQDAVRVALDRLADPDLHLVLLAGGEAWMRTHVVSGIPELGAVVYVGGRGLFEVERCDQWPSVAGQRSRVLLTMRGLGSDPDLAATG